jgi:hypothetical protein
MARRPVYLRLDEWALVDTILGVARSAMLSAGTAGHTPYPDEVSRKVLIWSADQLQSIRATIHAVLNKGETE